MKKILIITLSAILVTFSCVTGICFADSGSSVTTALGSESFEFTNLKSSTDNNATIFFEVPALNLPDASLVVSDFQLLGSYPLFNGLGVNLYYRNTDGNSPRMLLAWTFNSIELYSLTNFTYNYISQPSQIHFITFRCALIGNDFQVNAGYSASYNGATANGNFRYLVNNLSPVPSVSMGDFEYSVISSTVSDVVDFSLSSGYAFVIDGPCEIVERSYYINNSWDFTKNGNLRVNGAFENDLSSTYIRDGYSPDLAYSRDDLIQWEALNANIVGAASNYESYDGSVVQITDGQTYVIGYPQLYGFGNSNTRFLYTNSVNLVGHVLIEYSQRPSFRYVALESLSEFSNTGDFYTYSVFRPAVADVTGDVTSGSGGIVVNPSTPLPSGGGNAGQPPVDEDGSLLGTISRFVNDIKRLLSSAVEAINTLVNDGSSFMQSIGTMFSWLPAPLVSLLIAAFTVLVVMGVLKTLWR